MNLIIDRIESPIGTNWKVSDGASLCALDFEGFEHRMVALLQARYVHFDSSKLTTQLERHLKPAPTSAATWPQ